jgi:hypothetical protein
MSGYLKAATLCQSDVQAESAEAQPGINKYPRPASALAMQGIYPRIACIHDPAGMLETCDLCQNRSGRVEPSSVPTAAESADYTKKAANGS